MNTDKKGIALIAALCAAKGVRHVVISPGSRNAPLTIAFTSDPDLKILNITDERSAAFFALGIAQHTRVPTVLICTSGTALLNYAPAVAEAYYQRIPLLVLSSDRPEELIDQGEGQSIRQTGVFKNFIRGTYNFPQQVGTEEDLNYARRIVSEGLDKCMFPVHGPVHINVPMKEPLYGTADFPLDVAPSSSLPISRLLTENILNDLGKIWDDSQKVLVLLGGQHPDPEFNDSLEQFARDPRIAVLSESSSNVHHADHCQNIDLTLSLIGSTKDNKYVPDLLITFGENVISKKIKAWIRSNKPTFHWHVDVEMKHYDTFQCLTHHLPLTPMEFLGQFKPPAMDNSRYSFEWSSASQEAQLNADRYMNDAPYSDLTVSAFIHEHIPNGYNVHYANSTSVRYAQLFPQRADLNYFANRGTSGIDGCTSTAAGHTFASNVPTLLITGDVAFFYDSNALWNHHLSEHLRIIMINNGGGNIFRIIEGPDNTGQLEEHFEAKHTTNAKNLALCYNVPYYFCEDINGLASTLPRFFGPQEGRPAILEIKTPNEVSAEVLRGLFKALEKE